MQVEQRGFTRYLPDGPMPLWSWLALAVALGLVTGIATALLTPVYAVAAVLGLLGGAALVSSSQLALLAFVTVTAMLPFGVVPLQLGPVKLTFLDFVLLALLLTWLGRLLTKPGERLRVGPLGGWVVAFIGLALVSFALGTAYGITAETTRLFLKIVNSVLLYFTVQHCVRNERQLRQLVAGLIIAGAAQGALGLALYFTPAAIATRLLAALRPLGYPSTGILQYDADSGVLKAIGTAIDHNVLGALLMLAATVAFVQAMSARPVLDRRLILMLLVPIVGCLLLTYSRSSWMGFAAAVMVVGALKYRRLWLLFIALGLALYFGIVPQGEGFVGHLQSGLQAQDQATEMRLGEYKDAWRLIQQYPLFGVGFGGAPTIDLYVGVSSIYLLMAEEMGFVGLGVFLVMMAVVFRRAMRVFFAEQDPGRQGLLLSTLAAVLAALVAGIFDHPFFNLRFPHTVALFWFLVGLTLVWPLPREDVREDAAADGASERGRDV